MLTWVSVIHCWWWWRWVDGNVRCISDVVLFIIPTCLMIFLTVCRREVVRLSVFISHSNTIYIHVTQQHGPGENWAWSVLVIVLQTYGTAMMRTRCSSPLQLNHRDASTESQRCLHWFHQQKIDWSVWNDSQSMGFKKMSYRLHKRNAGCSC